MQNLKTIIDQKILIIVAHPDDETLWFFQSIQFLKEKNDVQILCMTYTSVSKRGKELQVVADSFGYKVLFGHCEDTGINHLLNENQAQHAFIKIFSKYKYDLVITHPPHGGEKPHPHHIQTYLLTKKFSIYHSYKFGFFSEENILEEKLSKYLFSYQKKKFISARIFQSFKLLLHEKNRLLFFFKILFDIWFNFDIFEGYETTVDLKKKQEALLNFASQEDILKSYNSFYKTKEYLFIQRNKASH